MKNIIKTVVSFLAVISLTCIGLFYCAKVTERKESKEKFAGFYEEENLDVLFLGSSHVLNGIFPMELWHEYGIVSYNMAGHGNRPAMNYWILKNALEYTTPKLVVLDVCMLGLDEKIGSLEQLHISVDHIPYSRTKVEMINDLVEDEEKRNDFLWKFSTYHHRWNELTKADFVMETDYEKGAQTRIDVAVPAELIQLDEDDTLLEKDALGVEYVCKIIEECKEREIEILITYLPFPDDSGWQAESDYMKKIAEDYDVNFLDFHQLLPQVNLNTDFYDADSHMNPSGARKISSYIGGFIMENYEIDDQRENNLYDTWHDDYELYVKYKKEKISGEEELKNLLMLLNDKDFSYGIYLKPWNTVGSYPVLVELLNGMGMDYSKVPNEDIFIMVDNRSGERSYLHLFENLQTDFADFSMFYNDDGHLELTNSASDSLIITYSDMAVVVFDNTDLSFVTQKSFVLGDTVLEFAAEKE